MKVELNGFEVYLIKQGLEVVRDGLKQEIRDTEAKGKNHLFTEGYVDMICDELEGKLEVVNLKDKEVEI